MTFASDVDVFKYGNIIKGSVINSYTETKIAVSLKNGKSTNIP